MEKDRRGFNDEGESERWQERENVKERRTIYLIAGILFCVDFVLCITTHKPVFPPRPYLDFIMAVASLTFWWFVKKPIRINKNLLWNIWAMILTFIVILMFIREYIYTK